ncbi:WD domain, G-beta repeat containing protein [Entamoeba histolytica HM-1:IMSS-B]|nr:WD domain containing protein [Entamoeba histolytica KU27]EMH73175.1 WD domain, G-beta repeat containing protein [Entamoeba histolytica HM-1:IMSS-B]EMS10702.1 WD domain, G-beta repeat-containing protein [Entamoeba histolytica HM-3:IMSS]ENY60134.1 WD domain, G-beta repeat-containing protein [Entamoeba histolytica HM-1:IMSS-A]GAT97275.1 WD domain containing protein [Entamoeba histolytica]
MVKYKKPFWMNHNGNPIFCMDSHPKEPLVATGGGDGKIKIWNVRSLYEDNVEDIPKLQAVITLAHNVNCLRWSKDGKLLACGCDDSSVTIYKLSKVMDEGAFVNETLIFREYELVFILRGHNDSVTDLSFSYDGKQLATASLDCKVILWDIITGKQIGVLDHSLPVYGVAFDPLNILLFSQCSNAAIIWNVAKQQAEKKITEQFKLASHSNFFLRPSWSPEGTQLVMVGAISQKRYVACVTHREMNDVISFQGHKNEVVCCRFSPCLYKSVNFDGKKRAFSCFVIGGLDNSLSVWVARKQNQVCHFLNVFKGCIQDITWLPGGLRMMACSVDGFVAYFEFNENEIGGEVQGEEYLNKTIEKYMLNQQSIKEPLIPSGVKKQTTQTTLNFSGGKLTVERPVKKRVQPELVTEQPQKVELDEKSQLEKKLIEREKLEEKAKELIESERRSETRKSLVEESKIEREKMKERIKERWSEEEIKPRNERLSEKRKRDRKDEIPEDNEIKKKTWQLKELEICDSIKKSIMINKVMYDIIAERNNGEKIITTITEERHHDKKIIWSTIIPFKVRSIIATETHVLIVSEHVLYLLNVDTGIMETNPIVITFNLHKAFLDEKVILIDVMGNIQVLDKEFKKIYNGNIKELLTTFDCTEVTKAIVVKGVIQIEINGMFFAIDGDKFVLTSMGRIKPNSSSIEEKTILELNIRSQLKYGLQNSFDGLVNSFLSICNTSKDTIRIKALHDTLFELTKTLPNNSSLKNKFIGLTERITEIFITMKP